MAATTTALAMGEPPDTMPIWARLQLGEKGVPFRRVTHFVRSGDGNTIGVAIADPVFPGRGEPVWLRRSAS